MPHPVCDVQPQPQESSEDDDELASGKVELQQGGHHYDNPPRGSKTPSLSRVAVATATRQVVQPVVPTPASRQEDKLNFSPLIHHVNNRKKNSSYGTGASLQSPRAGPPSVGRSFCRWFCRGRAVTFWECCGGRDFFFTIQYCPSSRALFFQAAPPGEVFSAAWMGENPLTFLLGKRCRVARKGT